MRTEVCSLFVRPCVIFPASQWVHPVGVTTEGSPSTTDSLGRSSSVQKCVLLDNLTTCCVSQCEHSSVIQTGGSSPLRSVAATHTPWFSHTKTSRLSRRCNIGAPWFLAIILGKFPSVWVKSVDLFSQLRMPQIMAAVFPIPGAKVVDPGTYAKCKCAKVAARTADTARH